MGGGLVVLGFIGPRSAERGGQIHGWRASAVAAEDGGRAVVDVDGHDRGGCRDTEDGGGGFEYVMRLCVERS